LALHILKMNIKIREIRKVDIESIANYWLKNDEEYLLGMGVDLSKLPNHDDLVSMLENQIDTPIAEKKSLALICEYDNIPVGHCNIVERVKGKQAFMHLHIWKKEYRKKGIGAEMVILSTKYFFDTFNLQQIISEPYALNPAPHKVLLRAGFELEKEYITTPGSLSFEQRVCRYILTREKCLARQS